MISASDRENAVLLIDEAIKIGTAKKHVNASKSQSGLSTAGKSEKRILIPMKMDVPVQIIQTLLIRSAEIRHEIINICNRPEYASMAPCEIVPALADEGMYYRL
ncbi:MAG: hypothetical protein V8Q57_10400 [Blautia sp.]